ncbi:hypothetical protein D3C84_578620 [compost metagenome]
MLVAKTNDQPLRRGAQEHFQRREILCHRQSQVMAGKFDFSASSAEGQVGAPKQTVIAERQALMAKVGAINRDAPATQPAQNTDHQHQERLFSKTAGIGVCRPGFQADDCAFATDR